MEEYQISLEDKVRNAFIRRKADFLVKAMNTDEYKAHAKNAKQLLLGMITSAGSEFGNNSYAAKDISRALKTLEETLSGDIEKQAIIWADDIYANPAQLAIFNQGVKSSIEFDRLNSQSKKNAKDKEQAGQSTKKLGNAFDRYLASIGYNETVMAYVQGLFRKKGGKALENINDALKKIYPEREIFIEKENEFAVSLHSYMHAMQELSDTMAEKDEKYGSIVTQITQDIISLVYKKAAEIEADEVYGKSI